MIDLQPMVRMPRRMRDKIEVFAALNKQHAVQAPGMPLPSGRTFARNTRSTANRSRQASASFRKSRISSSDRLKPRAVGRAAGLAEVAARRTN